MLTLQDVGIKSHTQSLWVYYGLVHAYECVMELCRGGWDVGATYPAAHDTIGRRKTPRYLNLYQIPVLIYTTKISKLKWV